MENSNDNPTRNTQLICFALAKYNKYSCYNRIVKSHEYLLEKENLSFTSWSGMIVPVGQVIQVIR